LSRRAFEAVAGLALALSAGWLASARAQPPPPKPVAASWVPADAPDRVRAVDYRLTARLDPEAHTVDGEGRLVWTNTSEKAQSEVYVHLYLNAFRDEESYFMRSEAGAGFRGGAKPDTWGGIEVRSFRLAGTELWPSVVQSPDDPKDATDIRVALPAPVPPGESVTFEMEFRSELPSVVARTGFHGDFHMVAQWFPKLARLEPDGSWTHFRFHRLSEFYADFGRYDVTIDVPEGVVVGATGLRTEERTESGRRRLRHRADWVHDFAFTAWRDFEVHEAKGPHGVGMRALVPPGFGHLAQVQLDEAAAAMVDLETWFGRYPYPTLTLVHPPPEAPEAGGMEYPTLICTGGGEVGRAFGIRNVRGVTTHELAHQWFYGLLGSDEHHHAFLDEGLTTFASARSMGKRFGSGAGFEGLGLSVSHWAFLRLGAAGAWQIGPIDRPVEDFPTGSDYGVSVYSKTAVLMETLRRVYGDEAFGRAMQRYTSQHRYGHPRPEDLLAAVREGMGEDAATQLKAGLDGGFVDYAVERIERDDDEGRTRVVLRRRGELSFPVEVVFRAEDSREAVQTWDAQERSGVLVYEGDGRIVAVAVDPGHRVLMDRNLSNNHRSFDRTVVATRAQGWAATALSSLWMVMAP